MMKRFMFAAVVLAMVCAGCTIQKYKGVSIQADGSGKVIQRVESESAAQYDLTVKRMDLKLIQL